MTGARYDWSPPLSILSPTAVRPTHFNNQVRLTGYNNAPPRRYKAADYGLVNQAEVKTLFLMLNWKVLETCNH